MNKIELSVVDLDETLVDRDERMYDGLAAVLDPKIRGAGLAHATSRRLPFWRDLVEKYPTITPDNGLPVVLERGARGVDRDSFDNIFYSVFSLYELSAIYEYISQVKELEYIAFQPERPGEKMLLWSPRNDIAIKYQREFARNITAFSGPAENMFEQLIVNNPCMITCRVSGEANNNFPSNLNYSVEGKLVNFLPYGIDKATGLHKIMGFAGIELGSVLFAGNEAQDLPGLSLKGLGQPVLVGTGLPRKLRSELPANTKFIPEPADLAPYLYRRIARR